ncbi:hypothetical protein L6R50_06440 [Myxococcota bacterium]|nr:hypothetical protein [Myxococcota bacterium]
MTYLLFVLVEVVVAVSLTRSLALAFDLPRGVWSEAETGEKVQLCALALVAALAVGLGIAVFAGPMGAPSVLVPVLSAAATLLVPMRRVVRA